MVCFLRLNDNMTPKSTNYEKVYSFIIYYTTETNHYTTETNHLPLCSKQNKESYSNRHPNYTSEFQNLF